MIIDRITPELVMTWRPCDDWPRHRIRRVLGDGLTPLEVADLSSVPVRDRLWCLLHEEIISKEHLRLLACRWAEQTLPAFEDRYPRDDRPRRAIRAARLFAVGRATRDELSAAANDAYDAAYTGVYTAGARAAARAAAAAAGRAAAAAAGRAAAYVTTYGASAYNEPHLADVRRVLTGDTAFLYEWLERVEADAAEAGEEKSDE